eukprot:6548297-Prymnesium_polylepis.2
MYAACDGKSCVWWRALMCCGRVMTPDGVLWVCDELHDDLYDGRTKTCTMTCTMGVRRLVP